ncbi:MAG: 16S rRNA (cytosine(967)-C(5))-methyltransferase RsmB [Eubacteriales bacterium]|nr:16S rRNA (cytosine(967)-C(5))-methyltransferase RsmB [Eubacteriales bacterium]
MSMDIPRETALRTLYDIEKNKAYSNISLDRHLHNVKLSGLDIAFVTELVQGVLKRKLTMDFVISLFSKVKPEKISLWIYNILRLGVYQLLFMSRVPSSAAVNESVKLAKRFGHQASAGFVNAVLRNIDKNKDDIKYPGKPDSVKHLSVKYSYPEWMIKMWLERYGSEFTEAMLAAGNEKPDYTIRVNTIYTSTKKLSEILAEKGFETQAGKYVGDTLTVKNPSGLIDSEEYQNGLFMVQDESSMLSVAVLNPKPGQLMLDVCSAPGGKAAFAAALMNNSGRVVAMDLYENKLEVIQATANRLGIEIIETGEHDAQIAKPEFIGKADRVLADVPCTGFGIIRKKPDIKWTRRPEDVTGLSGIQRSILQASSAYLKPDGVLVYSTCTFNPEENENIVDDFLSRNPSFEPVDFNQMLPEGLQCHRKGMLQLYPNVHGTDGFFIAKLRRTDKSANDRAASDKTGSGKVVGEEADNG